MTFSQNSAFFNNLKSNYIIYLHYIWIVAFFSFIPWNYGGAKTVIEFVAFFGLVTFFFKLFKGNIKIERYQYVSISIIAFFALSSIIGYFEYVSESSSKKFIQELKTLSVAIGLILTPFPKSFNLRLALIIALCSFVVIASIVTFYNIYELNAIRGGFGTKNIITAYSILVISLGVLLCLVKKHFKPKYLFFIIPVFSLAFFSIIFSQTRGAWLNLIFIFCFFFFFSLKKAKFRVFTILFILLLAVSSYNIEIVKKRVDAIFYDVTNYANVSDNANTSIGLRLIMWEKSALALFEEPILPRGYQKINNTLNIKKDTYLYEINMSHVHNEILNQWLLKGILGLISIFSITFLVFFSLPVRQYKASLLFSLSVLVAGLTNVFLFYNMAMLFVLIISALLLKILNQQSSS